MEDTNVELNKENLIPKSDQLRYITVKLNDNKSRRKISLSSNELDDQEGKENFESGKYGVEDVKNSLPDSPDGVSFESLMKDREELEGFQRFLEKRDPKEMVHCPFTEPVFDQSHMKI
ncbi:uncharacterized protein LOC124451417 isoform X2 [Xenia sp. Carnegie-2017]|uniref:uncharacterized protein LOC124451417 isoform X2 n=1 Tax=Xenia sp. Carnegie-2017 TaxID=2897299 RepID=UPI001F04E00F|nr:uncharacterized protein LOC124451417 isoform X2 [Xenia sp. Carnegie-2017]